MLNNAGIEGDSVSMADCTEENWDKTIAINLKGICSACNMKF
jgi:NAD(P)-dependent dehydrogenase (short-subunit alcohol dehydrogenase family)